MKPRAVFLDRDGVLVEEVNYLRRLDQLRVEPGAGKALARLRKAGFVTVLISNQSAVGRGYITLEGLEGVHREMARRLKRQGGALDAAYYCPHAPGKPACACRKPKLGMIKAAAKRFGLDLKKSYFIGDTTTDLQTARRAGCRPILVLTGKAGQDGRYKAPPDATCFDLASAVEWILKTS